MTCTRLLLTEHPLVAESTGYSPPCCSNRRRWRERGSSTSSCRQTSAAASPARSVSGSSPSTACPCAFPQCNLSINTQAGTLRGLHFNRPPDEEAKLVRCVRGAVYDVIVDLRPASPTRLQWFGIELERRQPSGAVRPAGASPTGSSPWRTTLTSTTTWATSTAPTPLEASAGTTPRSASSGRGRSTVISERDARYPDIDAAVVRPGDVGELMTKPADELARARRPSCSRSVAASPATACGRRCDVLAAPDSARGPRGPVRHAGARLGRARRSGTSRDAYVSDAVGRTGHRLPDQQPARRQLQRPGARPDDARRTAAAPAHVAANSPTLSRTGPRTTTSRGASASASDSSIHCPTASTTCTSTRRFDRAR